MQRRCSLQYVDLVDHYLPILIVLLICALLIAALYLFQAALKNPLSPRQREVFLSGHSPREHAISRFHPRWYPVALLFLAFDMEMVFMYPWAVVFVDIGLKAMVEMGMFLMILLLGVLYAWREGALRWT